LAFCLGPLTPNALRSSGSKDRVGPTINNPELTRRIAASPERSLGKENVLAGEPVMASKDFSLFALEDPKPPTCMTSVVLDLLKK
jgi:hypothetical protein